MTTPDDLETLAVAESGAAAEDADGRRRRGNRTRESILQAAADLASVNGLEGLTIGTLAAESPETLEKFVQLFGFRVCVGIDARDRVVLTHGWEKAGKLSAAALARRVADAGVDRIVYTDVSRDGTLAGPNLEQTCAIARESGLRVTASGGVSSLEDLKQLKTITKCGVDSVIVGKALYEGRFTLKEALKAA